MTTQPQTTIEHFSHQGEKPGPTLVIMGGVHGNERCGPEALRRVLDWLADGRLKLATGQLLAVPVANPGAYAANKRFLERNLNRRLYPKPEAERRAYEDHLDPAICAVLEKADYLLDIHSYTVGGPPFVFFSGTDAEEKKFALALDITDSFVWNWAGAVKDSSLPEKDSWGTNEYARNCGARAVTLECGQHLDPRNADVACRAILGALRHLGMIDALPSFADTLYPAVKPDAPRHFARMVSIIRNEPAKLARTFAHFEPIKKGEPLAIRPDGSVIAAKTDGFAILPNALALPGAETIYLAIDEEPFPAA